MHGQTLLFHLTEAEQLVHQFQQTVGVAVDDVQSLDLRVLQLLQRTDDQRYRGAYLVSNHREEVQTSLAHLLLFFLAQPL